MLIEQSVRKFGKKFARKFGVEIARFNPATSEIARMQYLFKHYQIDCVLDVGANVGRYVQYLRDCDYNGKVVSFEPLSKAHASLKEKSKSDSLWEVADRAAIGSQDSEITINISGNSEVSSVLDMLDTHAKLASEFAYVSSEVVSLNRLDTIAKPYVDVADSVYLKIDVQGYESHVLAGAKQILPKVQVIQLELSLLPLYKGQPLWQDLLQQLDEMNYELFAVVPVFTDMKTGRLLQMDGIFCQK